MSIKINSIKEFLADLKLKNIDILFRILKYALKIQIRIYIFLSIFYYIDFDIDLWYYKIKTIFRKESPYWLKKKPL